MASKFIPSAKYLFFRHIFRREFLIAKESRYGSQLKFKTEDAVGRHIFKNSDYEKDLSDFICRHVLFEEGDIALDIGANIGWYSLLLNNLMPEKCQILAFEPDPLNYELLLFNLKLNNASKVLAINCALSEKDEVKKLYRYSSRNLGRHSLLDINEGEYIEVRAFSLDNYIQNNKIGFGRVKFAKMDIEGYEYFALSGALKVLDNVNCLISEFVPARIKSGGIDPMLLIQLLIGRGFKPNLIKDGELSLTTGDELMASNAVDIIWLK
jgi:FkbM family methyltransferase